MWLFLMPWRKPLQRIPLLMLPDGMLISLVLRLLTGRNSPRAKKTLHHTFLEVKFRFCNKAKKNWRNLPVIYASFFYRSQTVLSWSKSLVPDQCLVLLQVPKCFGRVQIFCAGTKVFEEVLNAVKFFRLAQKIWTGTKHFGTRKRTRHEGLRAENTTSFSP